ncbi:MAG: hypothetical protein WC358_11830 [Ignavibacteria bacterium]|jgi:phage-related minor tail protein
MGNKVKETALTVLESKLTNPASFDMYNKKIDDAIETINACKLDPKAKTFFLEKVKEVEKKALKLRIIDEDTRIEVSNLLITANNLLKLLKDRKSDPLKKIDDTIKQIKADYNETKSAVEKVVKILKDEILRENIEANRKREAEERKAADKIRQEEEKLKKDLKSKNDLIKENAENKLEVKTDKILERVEEKAPVIKSVSTTTGNTVVKEVWTYDIIDIEKVPSEYVKKELKAAEVRSAINGGKYEIPGLKIYKKKIIAS